MAEWILFVDDEADMEDMIRQQFRKQIKEEKFKVTFARNGKLALDALRSNPELTMIVTDINMPEMDGLQLLTELKKLDRPLRAMVVSAYGDMKNIRRAMNGGAFDFVTKPIDFQDFETTLDRTLEEIRKLKVSIHNLEELNLERQKRMEAQEESLRILAESAQKLNEANQKLEAQVSERTKELSEKNKLLVGEVERSDQLLLNILPFQTAQELKQFGKAEARYFEDVSVMFTDFKGFTRISEQLSPADLVEEIDVCFRAFDGIVEKYGIEKIKTIGDSYMAASGLPTLNSNHIMDMVRAAFEIRSFMRVHKKESESSGKPVFEIRIGIHAGPVVAGIVGSKKFAYDIWGDTVNLASRMETACETWEINLSGQTFKRIEGQVKGRFRGEMEVKNKGLVEMYYLDSLLSF